MKTLALVLLLTVADWQHDLDELVQKIEAIHPDPFTRIGRRTFMQSVQTLRGNLPNLTDEQRMAAAMRIVASIRDGHTWLEPDNPAFGRWYPVRVYDFTDGYFITSAHQSVAELAGAQVIEIAGRPANEVIEKARDLLSSDNEFGRKEALFAIHNAALMRGLGYTDTDGGLRMKLKLRNGITVERTLVPHAADDIEHYKANDSTFGWRFRTEVAGLPFGTFNDWITAYKGVTYAAMRTNDATRPMHLTARGPYVARAIPDRDAYYVQLNQVNDNMVPFFKKALAEVDRLKPRRLIVDLRFNFGGDGSQVRDTIHQFIKREDATPWKELYVLTGRKTFSAGVGTLSAFIEHTALTLVGEPAGAGLNSYGDATSVDFPRTGMHLYLSTLRHELSKSTDVADFIAVDVPAPFSFADWVEGRDPAVDPILRGDEMRSIAIIAAESASAARAAHRDRTKRFAGLRGWSAPTEVVMRRICQSLAEQKRFDEAVDVCTLGTEIHPDIWNSWYNLGRTQRLAGMGQEALMNLAHVLDIDPANFNGAEIHELMADAKPALKPDVLRYGASVAETQKALVSQCKTLNTRRIDPPFLDDVKDRQMQIDCDGFMFQGKPRWTEFVFRDDHLEQAWFLTTKEDEARILRSMKAAYGEPSHQSSKYVAFERYGTALRTDKAEVLFYGPNLAAGWEEEFKK